jgi:hypothetical protein
MRFEKIWIEQCRVTRAIKRRFGARSALDYLVGESCECSRTPPGMTQPSRASCRDSLRPLSASFNEYELAGYVAMQKPAVRRRLRTLLYFS